MWDVQREAVEACGTQPLHLHSRDEYVKRRGRKSLAPDTLPWAKDTGYRPGLCLAILSVIFLGLTLASMHVDMLANSELVSVNLSIYLMIAGIRLFAAVTPHPDLKRPETLSIPKVWPRYLVLVPLYKESRVIESLMRNLSALDYPMSQLDIRLVCEADDTETIDAIKPFLAPPFTLVSVPLGGPRTKPNALNYALQGSDAEIVTIYDAEDRPHPIQLKAAVSAFIKRPDWVSVQAPLRFYNARSNSITRQFALEYAALFYVWNPLLSKLGLPFPLGGTSNHIRMRALEAVGGWDSHNVTEDADLSFRLAVHGGTIGYISPPTEEEIVEGWREWHNQRSRWMKGFMQTYNLHMHAPFAPGGWQGVKRFMTLQLTLGVTLISGLFHLPCVISFTGLYGVSAIVRGVDFPSDLILYASLIGYGAGMINGAVGALRSGQGHLLRSVPLMPLYWLALFLPTVQALRELPTRPFYWNKTEHGVTRRSDLNPVNF